MAPWLSGQRTWGGRRLLVLLVAVGLVAGGCARPVVESGDEPVAEPPAGQAADSDPPDHSEPGPPDEPADDEREPDRPAVEAPALPFRGAWVHLFDDTLKTRAGIAAVVEELAAAGATAVIAQVARRHDAYYPSEILPPTADPALEPGLDVVAELVEQAHAAGLEVHAWLTIAPTWHEVYEELPAPPGWLPLLHGRDAPEADRWVTRTADGTWSEYLDPALPEVRDHVAAVAVELVERYAVDGIHLDYARYESRRHGYHPAALERYRADTGATGTPAEDDGDWSAWRRAQTRGLVERVRDALAGADHDVVLSAAVISWEDPPGNVAAASFEATLAATEALQDWVGWAHDGLVDAVMPMSYFRAHEPEQSAWFSGWLAFHAALAEEVDILVVPGIGGWLNEPDAVLGQVHRAVERTDGAVVFSYQQPTADESRAVWSELATTGWLPPGGGTDG